MIERVVQGVEAPHKVHLLPGELPEVDTCRHAEAVGVEQILGGEHLDGEAVLRFDVES